MRFAAFIGALLLPAAAFAQSSNNVPVFQTGLITPRHAAMWSTDGVVQDAGPAGGGEPGVGLSELNITNTGTPFCINDTYVTNTSGYHQFCLGANALGGGLISYQALGGASPLPLQINVNGTFFPIPGSVTGVPTVAGNAQLTTLPHTFAALLIREDFQSGFGAPPLFFEPKNITCNNSGAGDGGSNVPTSDSGWCWVAAFPASGVAAADFGVSSSVSAAANTTALTAAAAAAYNASLPLNLCIQPGNKVTIQTNGSPLYAGLQSTSLIISTGAVHVTSCQSTLYQLATTGSPIFFIEPSPTTTAGVSGPIEIDDLSVDLNNLNGAGVLLEQTMAPRIVQMTAKNVPTGTYPWTDVNGTFNYPDAAITAKGVASGLNQGTYYGQIIDPFFVNGSGQTGIGVWLGTTIGQNTSKANVWRIEGGAIRHFNVGVYDSCDGDVTVANTDLSNNNIGRQEGGDGCAIIRPNNISPYLENEVTSGIDITHDVASEAGINSGLASTSGTTTVIDTSSAANTSAQPVVNSDLINNFTNGEYSILFPVPTSKGIIEYTFGTPSYISGGYFGGSFNSRSGVGGGVTIMELVATANDGVIANTAEGASIRFLTDNAWTSSDHSAGASVWTTPDSTVGDQINAEFFPNGGFGLANSGGTFGETQEGFGVFTTPGTGGGFAIGGALFTADVGLVGMEGWRIRAIDSRDSDIALMPNGTNQAYLRFYSSDDVDGQNVGWFFINADPTTNTANIGVNHVGTGTAPTLLDIQLPLHLDNQATAVSGTVPLCFNSTTHAVMLGSSGVACPP